MTNTDGAYDQSMACETWRFASQRYSAVNPWTSLGDIEDFFRTDRITCARYWLKQAGSYEQASARFLNKIWKRLERLLSGSATSVRKWGLISRTFAVLILSVSA